MSPRNHLALHTERIKASDVWPCEGDLLYLIFVESGAGRVTAFSKPIPLDSGDLVVVNGRSDAKMGLPLSGNGSELVFKWFAVSMDSLFPLFSPAEVSFLQNVGQAFRSPKVFSATHPIALQCRSSLRDAGEKQDLVHRSQLLKVVSVLLAAEFGTWQQKQASLGDAADDHTLQVFDQLSSHEFLELSVEDLADKFGCSRRHLSRLFHQKFGVSVATLRMEMRLLKAASLLRDPAVKIINVAEQCGFNHLGLFNTCFKRRFGQTPGMWKNAMRDQSKEAVEKKETDLCPLKVTGICPMTGVGGHAKGANGVPASPFQSGNPTPGNARLLAEVMRAGGASGGRPRPIDGQREREP